MSAANTLEDAADALSRNLKAIREPLMRRHVLLRYFESTPNDEIVAVLSVCLARSRDGDGGGVVVADTLAATLTDTSLLSYEKRATLYSCAKESGQHTVARLFFGSSPSAASDAQLEASLTPERVVIPRGRTLTLGERKSLARDHRREVLDHLLRDPHPDVIAILLRNPHLTESDVLVIASRRTPQPAALIAVARNHRWRVRYHIRRALVMNPHLPPLEALRLVTTLRPSDLRLVAGDTKLAPALRRQARELLK